MSDPYNPSSAGARARPTSVTVSSYLLYLVAALMLINALLTLSTIGTVRDVYTEVYAGTDAEGGEGFAVGLIIGVAVITLLLAIGIAVLAAFNNRGKNAARITTWVLGVIGVCCLGLGLAGNALGDMGGTNSGTGNVPDNAELQNRLEAALPSWSEPVGNAISVISLLALLAALILLALPPSNEFFRKPKAADWQPPAPGYPGYPPADPSQPGYPSYPPGQVPPTGQAPPPGQVPPPGQTPPPPGGQEPHDPPR